MEYSTEVNDTLLNLRESLPKSIRIQSDYYDMIYSGEYEEDKLLEILQQKDIIDILIDIHDVYESHITYRNFKTLIFIYKYLKSRYNIYVINRIADWKAFQIIDKDKKNITSFIFSFVYNNETCYYIEDVNIFKHLDRIVYDEVTENDSFYKSLNKISFLIYRDDLSEFINYISFSSEEEYDEDNNIRIRSSRKKHNTNQKETDIINDRMNANYFTLSFITNSEWLFTLINIAALFGSINIFKYLIVNHCEISNATFRNAIISRNIEIIRLCIQNDASFTIESITDYLNVIIGSHNYELFDMINSNKFLNLYEVYGTNITQVSECRWIVLLYVLRSCNLFYIMNDIASYKEIISIAKDKKEIEKVFKNILKRYAKNIFDDSAICKSKEIISYIYEYGIENKMFDIFSILYEIREMKVFS